MGSRSIDRPAVEFAPHASATIATRLEAKPGAAYLALGESRHAGGCAAPVSLSLVAVNDKYVRIDVVRRTP